MNKCLICGKDYNLLGHLSAHISQFHNISYKDYYDQHLKILEDGICKVCGNITKFKKGKYSKYCSKSCQNKDPENRKKNSEGVKKAKSNLTIEEIQEGNEKRNKTVLAKYRVENISQLSETKEKVTEFWENMDKDYWNELYNRRGITNLERYGKINPLQSEEVWEKIFNTNLEKYGTKIAAQSQIIKDKQSHNKLVKTFNSFIRFNKMVIPLFTAEEYLGKNSPIEYKWKCVKCDNIFEYKYINGLIPKCPICYPPLKTEENNIGEIIRGFYKGKMMQNSRSIINGELDYFFPELNIAIEYDGLYWHSEINNNKDKNYHLNKTKFCEEKNIKLIHIFEDEWIKNQKVVVSRIKNLLGCIRYSIYGRKCDIKVIDSSTSNKFLERYHIQGSDNASIALGAYYKTRLVAVMTFGKKRKALGSTHKENAWELMRFCTISNFNIIGIGGKLLSFFERNYKPQEIISYADRRWSQGNLYNKMGFKLDHISKPNYWYIPKTGQKRFHRYNFRKNVLSEKLEFYDDKLSEWENMQLNGYDRIWDCGNYVFIKKYFNT